MTGSSSLTSGHKLHTYLILVMLLIGEVANSSCLNWLMGWQVITGSRLVYNIYAYFFIVGLGSAHANWCEVEIEKGKCY